MDIGGIVMFKLIVYNGRAMAFIGGVSEESILEKAKMLLSILPNGYKVLCKLDIDEIKQDNIKINLDNIKNYYVNKYNPQVVQEYNWGEIL